MYKCNESCIVRATKIGRRIKHDDVQYHMGRKPEANREVVLEYCSTRQIVVRISTKPLVPKIFPQIKNIMPMQVSPSEPEK